MESACQPALQGLIAAGGVHLIVTHGGVIRSACERLLNLQPHQIVPQIITVNPASMTMIEVHAHPRLALYNLTSDASIGGVE